MFLSTTIHLFILEHIALAGIVINSVPLLNYVTLSHISRHSIYGSQAQVTPENGQKLIIQLYNFLSGGIFYNIGWMDFK